MFRAVQNDCANGRTPLPSAWKRAIESRLINLAEKCVERTGEEYITVSYIFVVINKCYWM